ncbi:type 1 glutamine amidotransferase family protein [Lactiplantibacillus plantarum]|uniref:type 1 glutamine amidotransferase family protein n=1 Tax=Lactiplantibacillus plantarum TaxID=1590 RepID=UPI000BE3F420|nr:type 1 glutamine amidotransferase family protein [Lactiplantibacillus plantarum]
MKKIYIYVLDTLADWELGYITAELNSRRFFKEDAPLLKIKTISHSKNAINTMGGIKITPDCLVDDIEINDNNVLLLPGADTWNEPQNVAIIEKASALLSSGGTVGAICGATVAVANLGLLDNRVHTSNGKGFLDMFCPTYQGEGLYLEKPAVSDNNLITASSTGALLWTKEILKSLDVFKEDTLDFWYDYFNTGDSNYFFKLMETLSTEKNK